LVEVFERLVTVLAAELCRIREFRSIITSNLIEEILIDTLELDSGTKHGHSLKHLIHTIAYLMTRVRLNKDLLSDYISHLLDYHLQLGVADQRMRLV
jgi:hypothetical protein